MIEREQARGFGNPSGWRRFLGWTAVGLMLAGCTGSIEGTGASGSSGSGSGSGSGPGSSGSGVGTSSSGTSSTSTGTVTSGTTVMPPPAQFVPQVSSLRRLTIPQYINAISDLLGNAVKMTTEFDDDIRFGGFVSIGVANVGVSSKMTEQFDSTAFDLAGQAMTNTATRGALVGCTPASAVTDDACTKQFLQKFGRRAWRRPMTDAELTRYTDVAKGAQTVLNDFYGGLRYALTGILQSPHFVYREEIGMLPDPSVAGRVAFNDYELATRLSFLLWNTTPDDTLLTAADGKQLTTGGLVAQAQRLLASDRLAAGVENFFTELYWLTDLDQLALNANIFPLMSATLGASMRTETLKFLNDLVFVKNGDVRDIFDSRSTFVNTELAKIYGLPAVAPAAGFVSVTLPDTGMRGGFLGQGSFLSTPSHSQPNRSSPTLRGKFVREMLLCESVAAPPPNVPAFPDAIMGTAREKLTSHRSVASCAACHAFMDPIGLGFENFDGIGAFRTMDGGKTIDATGDLDGAQFANARELGGAIKNSPDAAACLARNAYRYAVGHVDNDGESGSVTTLAKAFADNGYHFRSLLEAVVQSPGFAFAAKPVL